MNGWEAESDAATLLNGLGIETDLHYAQMADLTGSQKVKVLLAQALFGNPDILLLDEPTNHLDMESIQAVNKGLEAFQGVVLLASHDHELLTSTCNRVIAFQSDGTIVDRYGTYDDYLNWLAEQKKD